MDPLWLAVSYFNRRKYDKALQLCVELLTKNPLDQVSPIHLNYFIFHFFLIRLPGF